LGSVDQLLIRSKAFIKLAHRWLVSGVGDG